MPNVKARSLGDRLFAEYDRFRIDTFTTRHFAPEQFHEKLAGITDQIPVTVRIRDAGTSFEGRVIRLYSVGNGATPVLLWSQMHGDESTATMAIADILNYMRMSAREAATKKLVASLSIHFLPILNPDGAARCQRRTAQGIDMNRDALALATPEARTLRKLQKELKPKFGFNLHDQELSTVGSSRELTAVGLLAPAFDQPKADNPVRRRAKQLAAIFARAIRKHCPGRLARYDDTFEPRAFGDNMQKWGTSTLLVESGHAMNDPQKNVIRKLNFIGILAALNAIAGGTYRTAKLREYEDLPFNGKKAYDVIVRNVVLDHGSGGRTMVDLGISYQVDTHSEGTPRLVDAGDLSTYIALREMDGKGKVIPHATALIGSPIDWEKLFRA